jgi:hypothetical protein
MHASFIVFPAIAVMLTCIYGMYLMATKRADWKQHWRPWMQIVLLPSLIVMLVYLTKVIWRS